MNKYINPPTLSTSFSESGKSAKKRFDNILNTKAKKAGVLAFVLVLLLVSIIGMLIGFNQNSNAFIHSIKSVSFEIPKGWENKYEIEEHDNIVYVYHKEIREKYGETPS